MNCRYHNARVGMLLAACVLLLAACGGDEPPRSRQGLPDFTQLVKHVSPAVVNISARPAADGGNGDIPMEDWLRRFFKRSPGPGQAPPMPPRGGRDSLGSGFIISSDGYILTNRHLVADAGRIVVKLNDRRQLLAKVVGDDSYSDLAVLKVAADDLPTVKIGDPKQLEVGSWVVAIGSPFGFDTSVTAGIVSAKQRNLDNDQYVPFLQTDVAINPGNSGGPLFDLAGEVVGINSQIYSQTGGYQGVSFAIPIDIAMDVAHQLRNGGNVTRGWLGVQIQDIDRELAKSFKLSRPEGALVARVIPDSPAAKAGIAAGDVILALNGQRVNSAAALPPLVGRIAPDKKARVKVLRDGERRTIEVTIEALPEHLVARQEGAAPHKERQKRYGLTLEPLTKAQRSTLQIQSGGVKVTGVKAGAAARAGLQAGDVVVAVGTQRVANAHALRRALAAAEGPVALLVLRDGHRLYLAMHPESD